MKKILCCMLALGVLQGMAFAQESRTLDETLKDSAIYLKNRIASGSKVVVLNFQSDYMDLSNYIIDEIIALLVNQENMTVVDRQNLETIQQEMDFQMSGEVSDESAQSIGRKLGAQIIISGSIAPLGDLYRFRVRAIEVETAAIRGVTNLNIKLDEILALLTRNKTYRKPVAPRPAIDYAGGRFALDGKTRFGLSLNALYGAGLELGGVGPGFGGTVTVFEKFTPNAFVAPSIFISAKSFTYSSDWNYDGQSNYEGMYFFAGGAGILLKRRLTRDERFLAALGVSLEYFAGQAQAIKIEYVDNDTYYYRNDLSGDIGLPGMGVQGGLSYRLTPAISLDINGFLKFGFGTVDLGEPGRVGSNDSFTPSNGGAEISVSFMF
jgi:TolB-like protein